MTSLDPTHIPGFHLTSDRSTGQAVRTSVPAPPHHEKDEKGQGEEAEEVSALRTLSEKLAHADRVRKEKRDAKHLVEGRDAKPRRRSKRSVLDSDDDDGEDDGRVPIPPIPDLRFEQGVLASIRPFIHRLSPPASSASSSASARPSSSSTDSEKLKRTAEETVLATTSLTAEGTGKAGDEGEVNVFDLRDAVRVEWGRVAWVLSRDQVIYPLLQGVLWAVGGYYLSAFWQWNRARLDASSRGLPRPSLLRSLGIRTGY
ncbi:hypothetical protein JCM11251_004923 [Rhodosporidiobolus azoricus]